MKNKTASQGGFDNTNLGLAILIAESEDGQYEPVEADASPGER